MLDRYFDAARRTLDEVAATQGEPLEAAARLAVAEAERGLGRAAAILAGQDLRPGEVVLVASSSGVNPVPVEEGGR